MFCVFLSRGAQFGFSGCGVPASQSWFSTTFLQIVVEVMALGLPHICNLWLGVSMGMLPVIYLAPKILMAVNYCGRQLAQWLGERHLPVIRRKVQPRLMEHVGIACSTTGGLIGALGCGLVHVI